MLEAQKLSKHYGSKIALDNVSFTIKAGEIVGLIGPNGAGKSTLLKAIMGLINYSGKLMVFSQEPLKNRTQLLKRMSYIADVASLPTWMKVADLLEFVAQTHPQFDLDLAKQHLANTDISLQQKISTLSKGMKTRLHIDTVLSTNVDLLILDEPTLGLDVLVRRDFQDRLIKEHYQQQRSILITTHQVDEVENILTRAIFIKSGKITLDFKVSELKSRYQKLLAPNNTVFDKPTIQPIYQRTLPEQTESIFIDVEQNQLSQYGEVTTPSLEDLFVALNS